jgi:metal-responsive CopG/Arc/MetJ family transcriptional regulator
MASVKTGISLRKRLLERTDAAAREMEVSRSRLVSLALEEFLRRRESRELLERLNASYAGGESEEEREFRRHVLDESRWLREDSW